MNDMTQGAVIGAAAHAEQREALIDVLLNSLYPGASRASAGLVLDYCRAAQLDPMQKPVHIVPMRAKTGQTNRYGDDEYAMRDTIMPGIGLYRIQAARTGQYAGQDEPVIGPMAELTYKRRQREWVDVPGRDKKQPKDTWVDKKVRYPEWVSVTVYRLVGGFRVAFTAREYWLENYATAGADSDAPNAMWAKRTIGQLVKCAEAQALRKGFPEVGSQPTAEEMEGRDAPAADWIDAEPASAPAPMPRRASESAASQAQAPAALPDETAQQQLNAAAFQQATAAREPEPAGNVASAEQPPAEAAPAPKPAQQAAAPAASTGEPATDGERKNVLITARARGVNLGALLVELGMAGVPAETLDGLSKDQFRALKKAMA